MVWTVQQKDHNIQPWTTRLPSLLTSSFVLISNTPALGQGQETNERMNDLLTLLIRPVHLNTILSVWFSYSVARIFRKLHDFSYYRCVPIALPHVNCSSSHRPTHYLVPQDLAVPTVHSILPLELQIRTDQQHVKEMNNQSNHHHQPLQGSLILHRYSSTWKSHRRYSTDLEGRESDRKERATSTRPREA